MQGASARSQRRRTARRYAPSAGKSEDGSCPSRALPNPWKKRQWTERGRCERLEMTRETGDRSVNHRWLTFVRIFSPEEGADYRPVSNGVSISTPRAENRLASVSEVI